MIAQMKMRNSEEKENKKKGRITSWYLTWGKELYLKMNINLILESSSIYIYIYNGFI